MYTTNGGRSWADVMANAQPMWQAKAILHDRDYDILFLIPFKAINMTRPRRGQTLRLKVCRNLSLTTWTPVGYMSRLKDFGVVVFE